MASEKYKILLEAAIDQSSLSKIEKALLKKTYKIGLEFETPNTEKLATDLQKIITSNTITTWATNNTKAFKQFENQITRLTSQLASIDDLTLPQLKKIEIEFKNIQLAASETGNLGLTVGEKFKNALEIFNEGISAVENLD